MPGYHYCVKGVSSGNDLDLLLVIEDDRMASLRLSVCLFVDKRSPERKGVSKLGFHCPVHPG